jgi:ATP-dependent Clp protease adaptor protein ClpS
MKAANAEVLPDRSETIREAQAKPSPRKDAAPKRQPPYAVVLHNDDVNTFDHVVAVLRKVFQFDRMIAFRLTLQAHLSGRSIVWSGSLEVAELKADQIRSCGPDPSMMSRGALPLRTSVEPLPQ